jgi:hypothetical protein
MAFEAHLASRKITKGVALSLLDKLQFGGARPRLHPGVGETFHIVRSNEPPLLANVVVSSRHTITIELRDGSSFRMTPRTNADLPPDLKFPGWVVSHWTIREAMPDPISLDALQN